MSFNGPWDKNWELVEKGFGKGGQGTTHIVKSKDGRHEKAILKVLRNNKSPQARGRMHREVASLQTVANVGGRVPRVYDHNTTELPNDTVQLYVVMEFFSGQTLEELVKESKCLSLEDSIAVVRAICETVRKGHEGDVLHRDLKPQNLIVDAENKRDVAILAYGLSFNAADDSEELTRTSEHFANRFLDLPETNTNSSDHRDPRSDITAIAGILYYCLTAEKPGHLRDGNNIPPHKRPGHSVREQLPKDHRVNRLEVLFDRAFSQEISSRFETIESFLGDLDAVLAAPTSAPENPAKVAARATKLLQSADRKVVIAEFVKAAKELAQQINRHVALLTKQTAAGSIRIHPLGGIGGNLPNDVETLNLPAYCVQVGVEHHQLRRLFAYGFGVRASRCYVFRCSATMTKASETPVFEKNEELISFGRNEKPNIAAVIEDVNRRISEAIDFITQEITGTGVLP